MWMWSQAVPIAFQLKISNYFPERRLLTHWSKIAFSRSIFSSWNGFCLVVLQLEVPNAALNATSVCLLAIQEKQSWRIIAGELHRSTDCFLLNSFTDWMLDCSPHYIVLSLYCVYTYTRLACVLYVAFHSCWQLFPLSNRVSEFASAFIAP
jgi:hypothetical protein